MTPRQPVGFALRNATSVPTPPRPAEVSAPRNDERFPTMLWPLTECEGSFCYTGYCTRGASLLTTEVIMPTIESIGPYRFFFFAADRHEPPHVHVERDQHVAKFWLDPVRLAASGGFNAKELGRIQNL